MENQHRKINGYRELTQADIDLMNEIKALGPQIEAVCDKVKAHIAAQRAAADGTTGEGYDENELLRLKAATPEQWEGTGRIAAQTALMYLTRAVAQPTFF